MKTHVALFPIIIDLMVLFHASLADAAAEGARPADAFVDFVGVNTHLGYSDTTYGDYEGILKPRLLELGVRHIRDGTFNGEVLRKYLNLGHHGIRLLFITDSKRAVERAQKLGPMLYAIEAENEREDFIEDFAAGFLESFPPDAENNIHVGVVRFEVEAVKPGS